MYNLLVTAAGGAWDLPAYEFDRTRFLEYTADSVKARFTKLDAQAQEELRAMTKLYVWDTSEGYESAVGAFSSNMSSMRTSLSSVSPN